MIPSLDLRGRILGSRVLLLLLGFLTLAIPERSRAATLVDIAAGNPNFSTLVTAVQAAGLAGTLAGPGPFTVFAPDNAAFAKLPPATLQALLADPEKLRKVLLYHVVPGRVRSGDLVAGPVVTAQGAAAKITLAPSPKIDKAGIVATDVEADNGVIHVIDSVILPPPSLVEIAAGNPNFSTLVTAVQAAGLAGTLTGPGPFTVFAPDNAAFAKLPPATLQALLADPEKLRKVLLYHVVPGRVRSGDLVAGPVVTAQGAAAKITLSPSPKIDNAGIVATDVEADNGVIHVIDSVILPPPSLVEIATGNPNFSTLVTAVQAAGLAGTLAGPGPFTVFAPDNAAFAKLPPATLQALLADPEKLRKVLLYHVVPGRVRSGDLVAGPVVTAQGAAAKITLAPSPKIDNAGIVATDVEADNGVIHVIDSVILPPPSLVEIAAGNPNFSTLVTAVQAAGLAGTLAGPGPFTVFAPDNAAFAKLPPATLQALLADPEKLRKVLLYHVVPGRVRSGDLVAGPVVTAQGAAAKITLAPSPKIDEAGVVATDIEADNGVIHVIDSVILPPPSLVEIAADNPNFSTLVTAVQAAGLAGTLTGPGPFTVFAPDNAAFAKLPPATLQALLADPEKLRKVLLYHVVPGRVRSGDLVAGPVVTAQGAAAKITLAPSPKIDEAGIVATDIEADNGVIHVIDSVILPPPSLVEIAAGNPNFSTLVTAVQAAGLTDILTRTPGITVFAPDNAAFAKLPPGTLESLLANPERLRTVLLYHLVLGRVRSTDLAPGRVVTLQGAAARVNLESGVRINDSRVTAADIEASNGVLHVLDSVLLPPPDLVTLALATPQLSTFVAAVQAAGLAETFQAPGSYTVFAPSDDAFAKLPAGTLDALVADPERLRHLLLYHVHHGVRLRASDLRTGTVSTIQGAPLRVEVTPPSVTINGAAVLVPDGEAVNGVVHVVDSILFPGDGFVAASLSAVVKNGTVRLVWPAAVAGDAVLEAAAGPDGPWAAVGAPVTTGDGVNKVELNAAEDRRFFRLRAAVLSRSAVNPR